MRRQTRRRLKSYKLFRRIKEGKDKEGNRIVQYDDPVTIKAVIYPAEDKVQVMMYGERIESILNMEYSDKVPIKRGDALAIESDSAPDFRIKAIKNYDIKQIVLERI